MHIVEYRRASEGKLPDGCEQQPRGQLHPLDIASVWHVGRCVTASAAKRDPDAWEALRSIAAIIRGDPAEHERDLQPLSGNIKRSNQAVCTWSSLDPDRLVEPGGSIQVDDEWRAALRPQVLRVCE